jgi:hypothetical protein
MQPFYQQYVKCVRIVEERRTFLTERVLYNFFDRFRFRQMFRTSNVIHPWKHCLV